LREAVLIKSRLPAYNRALRRKLEAGVLEIIDGLPRFVAAAGIDCARLAGSYGPFASRASARATLRDLTARHRLCALRLKLERRAEGPCFARQLRRCDGACVGTESMESHDRRLADALAPLMIPRWPATGPALVREHAPGGRTDVHLFRDWCWLGTARDDGELASLLETPQAPAFDFEVTKVLVRRHRAGQLRLITLGAAAERRDAVEYC